MTLTHLSPWRSAAAWLTACFWSALAAAQSTLPHGPDPRPALPPVLQSDAGAAALSFQQAFNEVLAQRLNTDPQVGAAHSLSLAAQQRARQARSRLWPTLGVSVVKGSSTDTDFAREVDRRTERSEAQLRWNLYNGGTDKAEIAAADQELQAAQLDSVRARAEFADRLAEAWLEVQRQQWLLRLTQRHLQELSDLVRRVVAQANAGRLSEADAMQARQELADAQRQHMELQADARVARTRLELLAGRPVPAVQTLALPRMESWQPEAHPAVQAAQRRADAAASRVLSTAEALAPRVSLDLRQRLSDRTAPMLSTSQRSSALITLSWELNLGGDALARRDEAAHRADAARQDAERVLAQLSSDLAALEHRELAASQALWMARDQIEPARGLYRAAQAQFDAGRRSMTQLLQARAVLQGTERRLAEGMVRVHQVRLKQWSTSGRLLSVLGLDAAAEPSPDEDWRRLVSRAAP